MREARFVGGGSWHSKWSVLATLVRGILLNLSVLVLHRTLVIKSRRSLSVKMKETMGSFCCSCVESVTFGYPQHLWNSCHLDYEKSFFSWSIAKVPSYMITTSISSFYSPFLPLWMHMPCSCQSSCPEEGKPLHKKGLWMNTNLPPPSPSSVWQRPPPDSPLKLSRMWLFTIRVEGLCVENVIHGSSLLTIPVIIFL